MSRFFFGTWDQKFAAAPVGVHLRGTRLIRYTDARDVFDARYATAEQGDPGPAVGAVAGAGAWNR
ncbi:hypothetical protein VT84_16890 [Gemmata sp. SH-PL17]|uniref:hypothetical protein n=1 Tax=Gemmata sp. SH-PL17 TaxID=1630693 RepID=UPI00078B4936|nr:hypothetical protein [Gemmata sp. SH-PL17]AMV26077.1 hypothetical protein VT84_16890 [Gemmata sp. SH-PL17]